MEIKKYISVGVCTALVLTAGLVRIERQDVKVRTKGKETQISSVRELGEVLSAFAGEAEIFAPYQDVEKTLTESVSATAVSPVALTGAGVKSAKITVETAWDYGYHRSESGNSVWRDEGATEKATYYFSEEADYFTVEGTYWFKNNESVEKDKKNCKGAIDYVTEWYKDDTRALVRINKIENDSQGTLTIEGVTAETEIGTDKLAGIPFGKWLNVADLAAVIGKAEASGENVYSSIGYKSANVLKAFGNIFTAHSSEFKEKGGEYSFVETNPIDGLENLTIAETLSQTVFGFGFDHDRGDFGQSSSGATSLRIAKNKKPTLYSDYYMRVGGRLGEPDHNANVKTQIAVENVNCTVVKKLKSPKLGTIDSTALTAN